MWEAVHRPLKMRLAAQCPASNDRDTLWPIMPYQPATRVQYPGPTAMIDIVWWSL
jgi:hypothetical protein